MELETKHDFGQSVVMCCSTLLFRNMSGIDNMFDKQLKLLQEKPALQALARGDRGR